MMGYKCIVCYAPLWPLQRVCKVCMCKHKIKDTNKLKRAFIQAHNTVLTEINNPKFVIDLVFPVNYRDYWDLLDRHNCRIIQNIQYKFRRYIKIETNNPSEELIKWADKGEYKWQIKLTFAQSPKKLRSLGPHS